MDGISPARNWRLRWRRSGWMNAVVTVAITLLRPSGQPSTQWIWVVSFDISANGGWCHVTDFYQRNWLLCRNWWCGITPLVERSQVTIHICCVLVGLTGAGGVMARVTTAFIQDVNVVISYGWVKSCPSSHRLCPVAHGSSRLVTGKSLTTHVPRHFPLTDLLLPVT